MAFFGGQFKSATHGQFKSAQGGQFDRILQKDSRNGCFSGMTGRTGRNQNLAADD